jgi:transcriptional regulator with XRE-family HTH domain
MRRFRLNLIRARKALGWSQRKLAEKIQVSANALSRLENGSNDGHPSTWALLSAITGVPVYKLRELHEVDYLGETDKKGPDGVAGDARG